MNKHPKNISMIYDRDNIAVFVILRLLSDPKCCFIVANAHLLYNNKRGDIKLAQAYQIASSLSKLKSHYSR